MRLSLVLCVIAPVVLSGCVPVNYEKVATESASLREIVCIDNVEYIAIPVKDSWAIAPHYKPDGTLYTCTDSAPKVR